MGERQFLGLGGFDEVLPGSVRIMSCPGAENILERGGAAAFFDVFKCVVDRSSGSVWARIPRIVAAIGTKTELSPRYRFSAARASWACSGRSCWRRMVPLAHASGSEW